MKKKFLLLGLINLISLTSTAQFWDYSEPQKLPGTVNTVEGEESIPVFSKDSSILYFVRTFDASAVGGEMDQEIWFSKRESDGSYGDCKRLTSINNKFNNAVVGLGKSGTTMYVFNCYEGKKDFVKGIAVSSKKGSVWGTPVEVVVPTLDIEGDYYGFHVNESENVMIISYAGPGTKGQEDLYVSTKNGNEWSAPVHMGNVINTVGFEISPFLNKTQDTLYFSSNGLGGLGDADIFYSVKQGSWTNWSKPVNLGKKINSPKFDAYFSHSDKQCFWSSNRDGERSDIYMVNILTPPPLSASAVGSDVTIFQGKDGKIDLTPVGGVAPLRFKWSNGMTIEDPIGLVKGEYNVTITDAIGQKTDVLVAIGEPNPPVKKVIILPEVRYAFDKWELLVDKTINSKDSLNYIYNLLIEYPGMVIELTAYTDSRGSDDFNKTLSQKRAQECVNYLVNEKGIDPKRLSATGKGETQPRMWIDPATGKSVKLTEAYIKQFEKTDPAKFEYLHQLNRRTEGRIIKMK
jgi:outer membrane protein OmpA-like peptidoglycan-associated protein